MAEEKKKYNDYHLNVQMSRTFFSYKKPGDGICPICGKPTNFVRLSVFTHLERSLSPQTS